MNQLIAWRLVMGTLVALISLSGIADELTGKVLDLGTRGGIPGVTVTVFDLKRQEVGGGVTNALGEYHVENLTTHTLPLSAEFSNPDYVTNPTKLTVKQLKSAQEIVSMAKANSDNAYYSQASENLVHEKNESQRWQQLSAVASLRPDNRLIVENKLRASGNTEIVTELAASTTAQSVLEAVSDSAHDQGIHVTVLPNNARKQVVIVPDSKSSTEFATIRSALDQAKVQANIMKTPQIYMLDKQAIMSPGANY